MAEKTLKRGRAGNLMAIGGPQAVVYIGLAAILIIAQIISPGYLKMDHILTMLGSPPSARRLRYLREELIFPSPM